MPPADGQGVPPPGGRQTVVTTRQLSTSLFLWGLLLLVVLGLVLGVGLGAPLTVALTFLPAFVAGIGTMRQTAIAACCSFLVVLAALVAENRLGSNPDPLVVSGAIGVLCVAGSALRVRRLEEVTRLRSMVATLQRQLLQPLPLRTGHLIADGLYQPVEEDSLIGGDLYDVETSAHGTRVLIADVQGKGVQAVGTTLAVMAAFREAAHREPELTGVVEALENAVVRHNARNAAGGEQERFVTALVLDFDGSGTVRAIDCGHLTPYLVRTEGGSVTAVTLENPGVPLGLADLDPTARTVTAFPMPADATLFVCTDGVTEARGPDGGFYPLEARLRSWAAAPPDQLTDTLRTDLHAFVKGAPRDDIAWLTLRPLATP